MHSSTRSLTALACALAVNTACGDDATPPPTNNPMQPTEEVIIETAGFFLSNWGEATEISKTRWGSATIVEFDNSGRWAITQNAADASWNPGKFNKIVWTPMTGLTFYYCTVEFGLDTADAAKSSAKTADDSSPATQGCGMFPWTQMSPSIETYGIWATNFASTSTVTGESWDGATIVEYDNAANRAITRNAADASWDPGKYNKIVWTDKGADRSFHYCTVDFGLDTAADAKSSDKTADATDPDNSGCGMFGWTKLTVPLEIRGLWVTQFESVEGVASHKWGEATVVEYDNAANWAITQHAADAMWNPSKFSKIVWTELSEGRFYYCTVEFGLETAGAAKNSAMTANDSDPDNAGCGMFSWTKMSPPIEVHGRWMSNFGTEEVITPLKWGTASIKQWDDIDNWAVTQNADDDMWNPSKFSKVVWTELNAGSFYYCTVDYGLDTLEAAKTSTQTADSSDPDNSGCGTFSWTKLSAL